MGYNPAVGIFVERDPIPSGRPGADRNLYRYVHNNSTIYVDPSGLAESAPADVDAVTASWSGGFGAVFSELRVPNISWPFWSATAGLDELDQMLLGTKTECSKSIQLPGNLEVALARAVTRTKTTGWEWGGAVTMDGKGRYTVWGPVTLRSNERLLPAFSIAPKAFREETYFGTYHAHPTRRTELSKGDIDLFLGNPGMSFVIMTNCDGSSAGAIVALGGGASTATVRGPLRNGEYEDPRGVRIDVRVLHDKGAERAYEQKLQLDAQRDQLLAKMARGRRCCAYRRYSSHGALNLVQV